MSHFNPIRIQQNKIKDLIQERKNAILNLTHIYIKALYF